MTGIYLFEIRPSLLGLKRSTDLSATRGAESVPTGVKPRWWFCWFPRWWPRGLARARAPRDVSLPHGRPGVRELLQPRGRPEAPCLFLGPVPSTRAQWRLLRGRGGVKFGNSQCCLVSLSLFGVFGADWPFNIFLVL